MITLLDLVDAIGIDAARYALVRNHLETNLDIDLDLWAKATSDNPVFYVQYAHARVSSILRNAADLGLEPAVRPRAAHPREGGRPAARPRGVPAGRRGRDRAARAAPRRALPRGHRGVVPPLLRQLPGAADGRRGADRPAPRAAAAGRGDADRLRQRSRTARRLRAGPDVSPTHEAGWAHAEGALRGPGWLRPPDDANALVPPLWSSTARKVGGDLAVGGVSVPDLVANLGTPAYVLDEADFRARARAFRDAFAGYDVFYAGKAFLCTTVARWIAEEGLSLDVCSDGELAVALRAGFDPARIGFHGNNKTEAELMRPSTRGSAGSSSTRSTRSTGWSGSPASLGRTASGAGARDRRRRGPHPRVHRDRPRGPEVRLLDRRRRRARGRTPGGRRPGPGAARPALPHRQPDLRHGRLRGRRASGARAASPGSATSSGSPCPSSTSAAASASPTRRRTTRRTPAQLAIELTKIVEHECQAAGHRACRGCRSSPAGRSSVRRCSRVYEVGTVKPVELDGGRCAPTSASTAA